MPSPALAVEKPPVTPARLGEPPVQDMRAFLARLRPQSTAEALRLLRNAYPDAPLSLRVAACGG
jgi:hypothetical protein